MKAGSAFDGVSFVGEGGASLADDVVEFVDGRDMFVDDGLVDQRPQRFGWLQFWRVGRQEDQRHAQRRGSVSRKVGLPAPSDPFSPADTPLGEE